MGGGCWVLGAGCWVPLQEEGASRTRAAVGGSGCAGIARGRCAPCVPLPMPLSQHLPALLPALPSAGRVLDEVVIDEELTGRRAKQAGFVEPSFPTIAGKLDTSTHGAGWVE